MLLSIKGIKVYYEKSMALDDVSLEVDEGQIVSIIGANGAGKSTILRALSGLTPIASGEIWFADNKINGKSINEIVKLGIVHIPENRQLFPYLSVLTNLKLGASLIKSSAEVKRSLNYVFELFPRLFERRNQNAGTLSGGEQQMLAIARGLMAKPKLLLMDEPSLGLAPLIVDHLGGIIKHINDNKVTILLVEQNIRLAFRVANMVYALKVGKVIFSGDVETVKSSELVKTAYLGK